MQTAMATPTPPMSALYTGEMCILDHTGDTKFLWDKENADEVAAAKQTFVALRGRGFLAYTVSKDGLGKPPHGRFGNQPIAPPL